MEEESPSFIEENELTTLASSKAIDEVEYLTWEQQYSHHNYIKNPKRRRLVITTMLEEPILIEIRPNLPEPMVHSLVCNSTQCDVIEKECCKKNICIEHMSLWNELYQVIHDTSTLDFCEKNWFEKQDEIKDSLIGMEKGMNCSELWPKISAQALHKIMLLKQEIQKEKEERERYALSLIKLSDLEKQVEVEKNTRNQDCQTLEAIILELRNQITSQAEEIRRLWIENIAIENDEVNTSFNENKHEEDALKTKKDIVELEPQFTNALEHKIIFRDQEIQCEVSQLNEDNLEEEQIVTFVDNIEYSNLKLKIEELEKDKLQYHENITSSLIVNKDGKDQMVDYATLVKERDNLKEELQKVHNNFNRTASKLHDNIAKRRKLEAESESEKQQRSNLAAALYELENEVDETVSTIKTLQSTALESMAILVNDLKKFQEVLEKRINSNNFETKLSLQNDDEIVKSLDNETKNSPIQNHEVTSSKGILDANFFISKLTKGHENLLSEINNVRKSIRRALKSHKHRVCIVEKEVTSKLENIESERETFHWRIKALEEENKNLEDENSKSQQELSSLKHAKSNLILQLKDLEKEMEDSQENLRNLREENRRFLKEAKWKSVGKQGGYQESLIVQEWEKKLQKLEADFEILRHDKKDLVKEKHRLEDELEKALEKGYRRLGGSEDQKLEEELFSMTQERNKLRKIKITLAIENVSLKESLAQLRTQADALETECESLSEWKDKVKKLEEECEDFRDWKRKAEALEMECKELHENQMKVEAQEIECKVKNFKIQEIVVNYGKLHKSTETIDKECRHICHNKDFFEEECNSLHDCKANLEKECQNLHQMIDQLKKDQNIQCKLIERIEEVNENNQENSKFHDVNKLKINNSECGIEDSTNDGNNVRVEEERVEEERNKTLHESDSTNIENCTIQDYLERIAKLEQENMKLCQTHQATLDKQWDVLQGDLKAFEAKVEELENECESVRRDHLSSMVENAELIRDKEKILTLYNDQKYNYEILETANECLQKDQEQKEMERMKERNNYQTSIDNLNRQIIELESKFSERLHQQASNYEFCLAPKTEINGQETVTLSRQEYEILLAEKTVMLQERDSAHKKLCSAEVQNLQLTASIECLRQEVPSSNQGYSHKESDAEVLLAQDVVNLRSMLSSQEDELETTTCERNKLLEVNTSMRGELNELHEVLSRCQHENQNLNVALDELKRRSSLEQIHSAASSLKEQLGKASKEKDSIKEQLNKVTKEKEQLANVANERDKVIFSLKERITKLEKEEESTFKIQLQDVKDNENDQSMMVSKEGNNVKEEVIILKQELKSLNDKMLFINDDVIKKTKAWQKERNGFEEKCRKLEIELMNTKEALAMMRKKMQDDLQEAIEEKANFELVAKNEVKGVNAQVSQLQDELLKTKQFFDQKLELVAKEMEHIMTERNTLLQEIVELKDKKNLVYKEKDCFTHSILKCNEHKENSMLSSLTTEDLNQPNFLIPKNLLEQGIQVKLQEEEVNNEIKEIDQFEKEANEKWNKKNDEFMAITKERDFLILTISQLKMEKNVQSCKDTCFCNCDSIQIPNFERNLDVECCCTLKENHNIQKNEKEKKCCVEVTTLNQKLQDFETRMFVLNEQLVDLTREKDQLKAAKESLIYERDSLLATIAKLETEKEKTTNKFEQDLNMKLSIVKALLATATKEKEQLTIYEGSLHKKIDNLSFNVKSLNEQLVSISSEKDCLVHAKEVVTLERDDLLAMFEKQQKNIFKLEEINFKKESNENPSLMHEKISLLKDNENLIVEIVLLKKEKEAIENKLDGILKQNSISSNDFNDAFATIEHELLIEKEQHAYLIKENIHLKEKNVTLVQTRDHFIHECKNLLIKIASVKNENEEVKKEFKQEMVQLISFKNKLLESINKEDQLVTNEVFFNQENNMLQVKESSQENYQPKLEGEISKLNQTTENLVEDKKRIIKKCNQYDQMKNEYSSLSKSKTNLCKEYESFFKEEIILENEKEEVAYLLENHQMNASIVTLKSEIFSLNEKINKLIDKNEKLHNELKASTFTSVKLEKENKKLFLENEALTKEKNSLIASISLLKKEHETIIAQEFKKKRVTTLEVNLQQKFEELFDSVNTLNKSQEGQVVEKELLKHTTESLTKECDNLFATITSLKSEQPSPYLNVEEQKVAKVDQSMIVEEKESTNLEAFLREKLNEFAKKAVILLKGFIASTKEREKLILEMTSLKRECQKIHTTLIAAERDKDTLMNSVLESRATFDHLAGENNRLQRELVDAEMKLAHITVERDNANLQIVDLQRLLSNHQRVQHLQGPYSLENVDTLEAQNRCLRMEKDVIEEHLKKCSIELEGNYRFQQQLPSMTNFKIQKIDSHPPLCPPLHSPSQLFLSGLDSIGRPRPPPPPILLQQWPM